MPIAPGITSRSGVHRRRSATGILPRYVEFCRNVPQMTAGVITLPYHTAIPLGRTLHIVRARKWFVSPSTS